MECKFVLKRDEDEIVVTWGSDSAVIEFDMMGNVVRVSGTELPEWLAEDLEQNEAERRNDRSLGDAWSGGFAENH